MVTTYFTVVDPGQFAFGMTLVFLGLAMLAVAVGVMLVRDLRGRR